LTDPQLSVIVGAVQFTTAWQDAFAETMISEGHPVTTGSARSVTTTLKVQVDVFPAPSVAVYTTGVVPTEKISPGFFVLVIVTLQLSEAVGTIQLTVA
jgi:hypothetical protein